MAYNNSEVARGCISPIFPKKYPRCSQSKVTIGKNGVAYNNSDVARGRISPIFPKMKQDMEFGFRIHKLK